MNTITIKDETASGKVLHEIALRFEKEYITVKELIESRIKLEVEKYESQDMSQVPTLVTPLNKIDYLNAKRKKSIDVEKQIYVALDAFQNNGFFILVDDEQVDQLDQRILIDESSNVSFIKLTPLVGG